MISTSHGPAFAALLGILVACSADVTVEPTEAAASAAPASESGGLDDVPSDECVDLCVDFDPAVCQETELALADCWAKYDGCHPDECYEITGAHAECMAKAGLEPQP